jgi:RNA-directed DNA polymerase
MIDYYETKEHPITKRMVLEAYKKVKSNGGGAGVDEQSLIDYAEKLPQNLYRLWNRMTSGSYMPSLVKEVKIPKKSGGERSLGIPMVYDRVCQQALLNRLEPIFEAVYDDANFGYRKGRSTKDALKKVWKEIQDGNEWIVDADLEDFFGTADYEKIMTLLNQRVSDGRILNLMKAMLKGVDTINAPPLDPIRENLRLKCLGSLDNMIISEQYI